MDKEKKNIKNKNTDGSDDYDFYDIKNIASTTEYTGMVQTPPLTDAEEEAYSDIYYVPQQKAVNAKKADSPKQQEERSSTKGKRSR